MAALLHPEASTRAVYLTWLKTSYEAWQRMRQVDGQPEELRTMLKESWFHQQLVKEVMAHLVQSDFREVPPAVTDLLTSCFRGLGQSKVIEDGIK
eukprot:1666312-Lingulodinium_polyedra.AAC.1